MINLCKIHITKYTVTKKNSLFFPLIFNFLWPLVLLLFLQWIPFSLFCSCWVLECVSMPVVMEEELITSTTNNTTDQHMPKSSTTSQVMPMFSPLTVDWARSVAEIFSPDLTLVQSQLSLSVRKSFYFCIFFKLSNDRLKISFDTYTT